MTEKMRVLEMLDNGKINAEEATKLLEALGKSSKILDKEQREQVEEKFQKFAADVNKFAKDVGEKICTLYKNVEPKIKKASQTALEKAACALDDLAHSIHDSLEKANAESCCDDDCDDPNCCCKEEVSCCAEEEDAPRPN